LAVGVGFGARRTDDRRRGRCSVGIHCHLQPADVDVQLPGSRPRQQIISERHQLVPGAEKLVVVAVAPCRTQSVNAEVIAEVKGHASVTRTQRPLTFMCGGRRYNSNSNKNNKPYFSRLLIFHDHFDCATETGI